MNSTSAMSPTAPDTHSAGILRPAKAVFFTSVACLLALCLLACRGEPQPATSGASTEGGSEAPVQLGDSRPPVIILSIDTLRADRLPAYGYEAVETPHIDALRRDGLLFQHA